MPLLFSSGSESEGQLYVTGGKEARFGAAAGERLIRQNRAKFSFWNWIGLSFMGSPKNEGNQMEQLKVTFESMQKISRAWRRANVILIIKKVKQANEEANQTN